MPETPQIESPAGVNLSSWYASFSLPALVVLAALALYAFRISLGNQPVFGAATLED